MPTPVQHLELIRNEFLGTTLDARSGVYDVICRNEHLRVFILEMQREHLRNRTLRLMFYVFHYFNSQVVQGAKGFDNVPPVICICILEGHTYPDTPQYHWRFLLRDAPSGKTLSDKVQVHLIEMGTFPILREESHKVNTDLEKLIYTMKYAHTIDPTNQKEAPKFWTDEWLAEAIGKLDLAKMSPEEKAILDMEIVKAKMVKAQLEEELMKKYEEGEKFGLKRGFKKGKVEGKAEGKAEGIDLGIQVIQLFLAKKTTREISNLTKLPEKEVEEIIRRFNSWQ